MSRYIKNILIVVFISTGFSLSISGAYATPPPGYSFTSFTEGYRKAKENGKPLFIYIGRQGCGFCDLTNQKSFSDSGVKDKFEKSFNLVYMDTEGGRRLHLPTGETLTELEFTESLGLKGTPVFIVADINVKPDNNKSFGKKYFGFQTIEQLLMMVD